MTAQPLAAGAPTLDKYEVLEEIGHGGMATVYRARDPRLGRDVAVKVIHKHLRENAEVATRFVAEARAAAKLRHRGIVEVYDVSNEDDDERFLVVELLRGTTLRKILQQHREMPAEVGASLVLELCEALEHAHESGIIHRDVKPENVLVELPADRAAVLKGTPRPAKRAALVAAEEGEAARSVPEPPSSSGGTKKGAKSGDAGVVIKLTDFGIAKILDAQGVTSTGQVLGSPAHMAPEQIEGGEVDARTDVFALGVLMYECLVGHLPFEGKNPAQVLRRVLDGIYPPADRERATVGGRWAKILAGALARDAVARTATPAALGEQIRAELDALAVGEPRDAVNGFFADPAGYSAELVKRLVPRLVARGEAARKQGDVTGAAADYNRALALAPNDLAILKRVTSLTSSESRRALARRLGAILAGSVALGLVTFGVVRWMRAHPGAPASTDPTARPSGDAVAVVSPSSTSAEPGASGAASASAARVDAKRPPTIQLRFPIQPTASATAVVSVGGAGTRMVQFNANSKSASVLVDGQAVQVFAGPPISLSVGPHSVQASVPNSKCCKAFSGTEVVKAPPPDRPGDVQKITVQLSMNPTTVSLAGAPPGGELRCSGAGLTVSAGSSAVVTLKNLEWLGTCEFKADGPGRKGSVKLLAGEAVTVPWLAGD